MCIFTLRNYRISPVSAFGPGHLAALALLAIVTGCATDYEPKKQTAAEGDYRSLERAVFEETNRLRANAGAYAKHLKGVLGRMEGNIYYPLNSEIGVRTKEGPGAVKEAIRVLDKEQKPLTKLKWSEELAALARAHVADTGPKGLTGHNSSDGKKFSERVNGVIARGKFTYSSENLSYGPNEGREVVMQLIIDDGVPSRGHRKNLLKGQINYTGVGCGYHRQYGHMCAAIYAYR